MAQQVQDTKYFEAEAAIAAFVRVKLGTASTQVVVAGSDEACIGITQDAAAAGDPVPVKLWTRGSTFKVVVGEAIDDKDSLYGGANGKFVDTNPGSGTIRATALGAGSGDGSVIEVLPV